MRGKQLLGGGQSQGAILAPRGRPLFIEVTGSALLDFQALMQE